jgi:hypothetical protein
MIARALSGVLVLLAVSATAGERPLRLRLTPFDVPPGADRIPCEYVVLPNPQPMDVRRVVVRARPGLHHIHLYAYLGDDRDPRYETHGIVEGAACAGVGPRDRHRLSGGLLGAVRDGAYDLPDGYAVSLLPEQPVYVSTHFFNPRRRSRRAAAKVILVPAAPGTARHRLRQLDAVTPSLELPPGAVTVRTGDFVATGPLHVAMVSSHQHRLGTRATIRPVVGGVEGEPIYENRRWSEPPLRWLDPPIRLAAGDRLRIRCEWRNTTDAVVRHGSGAHDEMCNLNGYVFDDGAAGARTSIITELVPLP